jgi:hypothetical protein
MKIHGVSLTNRFYVTEGWTKEKIAKLLQNPKDIKHIKTRDTYFAVYNIDVKFIREEVEKHEFVPLFKNQTFEENNFLVSSKWSKTRPIKEGFYWFYGTLGVLNWDEKKELLFVRAYKSAKSINFVGEGRCISEDAKGVWLEAVLPELPEEECE